MDVAAAYPTPEDTTRVQSLIAAHLREHQSLRAELRTLAPSVRERRNLGAMLSAATTERDKEAKALEIYTQER